MESTARTFRLGDRLAWARRDALVGREPELELFRSTLQQSEPSFALLFIIGPGGIGKTTLLREYARLAQEHGLRVIALDGHNLNPSPNSVLQAMSTAMSLTGTESPFDALAALPRSVLLIDTFETLSPLALWFAETFLPQLPQGCFVVIAGRNPPSLAWRNAPGWHGLIQSVSLRNLSPETSRAFLTARGVPAEQHQAVLEFTHGHPLALSLVAEVTAQRETQTPFVPENQPDVVQTLLERFLRSVPSAQHRFALQVCAHVRVTTEDLLARALGIEDAHDFFEWLRGLSFIEQGPQGLFPHDLARDVIDADLRWRNRQSYGELHRRVRDYVVQCVQERHGLEQQRAFLDLLYLHRNNRFMKPYYDWESMGNLYAEPARAADRAAILEMVRRHEGELSERIASYWLDRQPEAFLVFRGVEPMPAGFVALISLEKPSAQDVTEDPAMQAACRFIEPNAPLRPGEQFVYSRFSMAQYAYQMNSPEINLVAAMNAMRWLTTPKLAWAFIAVAAPEYWQESFQYLNFARVPDADFQVGERRMAVFAHDWRAEPPFAWLDVMAERELAADLQRGALNADLRAPLLVLSQPEFNAAVRDALRDFSEPAALATNPLLRSRLVLERSKERPALDTLRGLIMEAAEQLEAKPKDSKFFRALNLTYLAPAPTQELAAERLGLPFGTYRYQLAIAIKRVTAWLWERELAG